MEKEQRQKEEVISNLTEQLAMREEELRSCQSVRKESLKTLTVHEYM